MIRRFLFLTAASIAFIYLFSGCGTIVGGHKYFAHVTVANDPKASIYFYNEFKGVGYTSFKVPRKDANMLSIKIQKEGCQEQYFNYTRRSFRGWALFSSIAFWSFTVDGFPLPIPLGIATDLASGALWKPNKYEYGISKINYKHYNYRLEYTGCISDTNNDTLHVNLIANNQTQRINKHSIFYYNESFKSFDIYYDSIISTLKKDPSIIDLRLESDTFSNGTIKYIGLKANHIYNKNPEYNYKIGTWRYFYDNGQLKEYINYDLEENKIDEKRYDEAGNLTSKSDNKDVKTIITQNEKININAILINTSDERISCEIIKQDDQTVYFKYKKGESIISTSLKTSQIKDIINIY